MGAAALAAGCASKPAPAPAPAPIRPYAATPAPARPTEPAPLDWRDVPLTPGGWTYSSDASGSQALFGPAGSGTGFMLRCDRARGEIVLSREGAAAAALTVGTSFGSRSLPAVPAAALPSSDPLLDQIAFSRGRITIAAPGLPTLVIPAWPEPARVIEDCRE
jgi:hypothetical protein